MYNDAMLRLQFTVLTWWLAVQWAVVAWYTAKPMTVVLAIQLGYTDVAYWLLADNIREPSFN